jgi:hypothetical protein
MTEKQIREQIQIHLNNKDDGSVTYINTVRYITDFCLRLQNQAQSLPTDSVMLTEFNHWCNEWGMYNSNGDSLWREYSPLESHHRVTRTTDEMLVEFKKHHSA